MLRPERMSKVSVAGSRAVMKPVIDAIHDLNLVHLSDYDGSWEGFDNGDPAAGAEAASEKLVTVRSLQSILGVEDEDAGPSRIVDDEALDEELAEIQSEVNELDDRRSELRDELREVDDRISSMAPFAELGIDLDLLGGYDTLDVRVGEGDEEALRAALADADSVDEFELFGGDGDVVAAFVYPADDAGEGALDDALVGVDFAELDVPDAEGSPEEYLEELRHRKQQLESKLDSIESELEEIKVDAAGFLLAAEEKLSIEVQQTEAPLQFATTERAFVAEGWVPTDRYDDLVAALDDAVGDRVEVEELERAEYTEDGHAAHTEEVDHDDAEDDAAAASTGDAEEEPPKAATDGGTATATAAGSSSAVTMADDPPVIQDNVKAAQPFEFLLEMINRPKYSELDPTLILLLTFPAFYGFMLGDLGYGLLYIGVGYLLYSRFEDDVFRSLGAIGMWAGGFTALFGVLYGEMFGMHFLGEIVFPSGSPPMHKGLQPAFSYYGQAWLVASLLLGLLHLTIGYVFGFINDLDHGVVESYLEHGSWATLMIGLWTWVFSRHLEGAKPDMLYTSFGPQGEHTALNLGFSGLPEAVGLFVGVPLLAIGFLTMVYGEVKHYGLMGILIGGLESFSVFGDVLSYLRIGAVILAKAGMAFVVNLLFFGVYVVDGEWHFATSHAPSYYAEHGYHGHEVTEIMFGGLLHGGIASAVAGVFILVIGHLVVLLLGVTSAGLQGIRLEYVEFFDKFYEGGGRVFSPFGYDREYTAED
ncbi:V/A-type H+-transporting ATPase subunit I [Natronoarchaeum philippinense]|uniref:A-type ATP synthase subunit I n=1 Tax=Natronoarchaeum philippinense TaxID=558529 RepID=A0A285P343_NATPI|nr:V-type ATP synthase subunit I [Natronoarchaeum philippinense]SNZ16150.1 V/A-type H+-transporting ATPase subunit I [Natronoarchaeum philippinense]